MHIIIKNIDANLSLLNILLKSTFFIEVSSKPISNVFPASEGSLNIALMNESSNGIGKLMYFKLMETRQELIPFYNRLFSSSRYENRIVEVGQVSYKHEDVKIVSEDVDEMMGRLEEKMRIGDGFITV